ncbi:TetR/AcrR family transcriptional regulator [Nocardia callitridis]
MSAISEMPQGRPSLREEQKTLTHNRVLDAAVTVFGEKQFLGATIDDIARAAGVTRATVYAHFAGGKAELVDAVVARVYGSIDEAYAELTDIPEWTRSVVREWLTRLVARWAALTPTIRVLSSAGTSIARSSDEAGQRYLAAHERHVTALCGNPERWQGCSPADRRQRALMAVLQTESFLTVWISGGWAVETEDPLDLLADAVCHLLAPALRG